MKPRNRAILIVDDDPNDLELIKRAFRKLGIPNPILSVDGGNEAIRYLNGEAQYADRNQFSYPCFIITDLKMGDGDGFRLLHDIQQHPQWSVIPTIVLSGSADEDDIKKTFLLGATSFFKKPISMTGMQHLVQLIYEYWDASETPATDESGQHLPTRGSGKLAEWYQQPDYVERPRNS